jgi:hypothetical protein
VPRDHIPVKCRDLNSVSGAAVLQVNKHGTVSESDDWCYLVGTAASQKVTLLQSDDPTQGIRLTYLGDYCHGANPKPRTFNFDLNCADRMNPVPLHVYETSPCEYTISMPSVYGCPLECPVANRHLCAGNGHCAFDVEKKGARCFCNNGEFFQIEIVVFFNILSIHFSLGYSGPDCTSINPTESPSLSPASVSPTSAHPTKRPAITVPTQIEAVLTLQNIHLPLLSGAEKLLLHFSTRGNFENNSC